MGVEGLLEETFNEDEDENEFPSCIREYCTARAGAGILPSSIIDVEDVCCEKYEVNSYYKHSSLDRIVFNESFVRKLDVSTGNDVLKQVLDFAVLYYNLRLDDAKQDPEKMQSLKPKLQIFRDSARADNVEVNDSPLLA